MVEVVVAGVVVVVVGTEVLVGSLVVDSAPASATEQAERINPSETNNAALVRITRIIETGRALPDLSDSVAEDASGDVEVRKSGLVVVDGDGQLDAFGIGVEYVEGIDIHSGIGEGAGQTGQLTGTVRQHRG